MARFARTRRTSFADEHGQLLENIHEVPPSMYRQHGIISMSEAVQRILILSKREVIEALFLLILIFLIIVITTIWLVNAMNHDTIHPNNIITNETTKKIIK